MPQQRIADPYATLGVRRDATSSQIRAAYRRLAKRHHPDIQSGPGATEEMRRVNQAWEVLSSPSRRREYDASARPGTASAAPHWGSAPRQAPATGAAPPPWATYGSGPLHADARWYGSQGPAAGYEAGPDRSPSPLLWAGLMLFVPVAVLSAAVFSAGLLPFPLFLLLVLIGAGRLFGRDR